MEEKNWLLLVVSVISIIVIVGFFITKTKGFGRFSTSSFLLLLIVVFSTLLLAAGKIESKILENLFFAIIGFSGGLFTSIRKENNNTDKDDT